MEQNNFSYAKRKVIIIPMFFLMIIFIAIPIQAYTWNTAYVYDEINDSSIDWNLWMNTTTGGGVFTYNNYTENTDYIYQKFGMSGVPSSSSTLTAYAMPSYTAIDNITMKINLSVFGQIGIARSIINVYGINIISLVGSGGFTQTNSSVWFIKKNGTQFMVYEDGVYQQIITPINNNISFTATSDMNPAQGSQIDNNIFYVYYSTSNTSLYSNYTNPINGTIYFSNNNISFNVSTNATLNSLKNISYYLNDIILYQKDITGTYNFTNFSYNLTSPGNYNFYVETCDNESQCAKFNKTYFSVADYIEGNTTYNATSYETERQSFNVSVKYDNNTYPNAYAYMVYDGNSTNTVKTYDGINTIFSSTIDVPASTGVKQFYFMIYFDPSNPTNFELTTVKNQTINAINFINCAGSNAYINMNYFNEISPYNPINLSVSTSTWTYWLGAGTTSKSYFFNTIIENTTHSFCFTPIDRTMYTNINYQYGISGTYPVRTYQTSTLTPTYLTLTNSTTNVSLYTIAAADSASITFQVSDASSANILQDARLTITKSINGANVQIFDGYTDGSGLINVWLSTSTSYTLTASKEGCGSMTKTITPVNSYNIQLNCAGNLTKYVSQIDGVTYQRSPADGATSYSGTVSYQYYVKSLLEPIMSAKFSLVDESGNIVATNETYSYSLYPFCTNSSCLLSLEYTTACGDNIKGRYYVNLGNTTNYTYVLLEGDALWRFICINTNNSQQSFTKFINHFNQFFYQWSAGGQTGTSCRVYNTQSTCNAVSYCKWLNYTGYASSPVELCTLKDDYNKAEFNRVLIIFFGMVIVLFIIGKTTGYEMTNPGSFVMFMTGAIIIMSFAGMFRFSGATLWPFFDQWIFAFICTLLSLGYNIAITRRYST